MEDGIYSGSIFAEHLFSRTLFGGPLATMDDEKEKTKITTYFLYRVVGNGVRTSELQFLEECRLLSGPEPFSQSWIQDRYGAGTYQVMMTEQGGAPRDVRRFMITPPSGDVPAQLSPDVVDAMPLEALGEMLASAMGPLDTSLTSRLGQSISGGWLSTLRLIDSEGGCSHPWLRLLPTFQEHSDTDIYRAFVAQGHLTDRMLLKEHVLNGISMVRVVCEKESSKNWLKQQQHRGTWHLWLDDERDPRVVLAPDNGEEALGSRYRQYVDAGLVDVDWRWAKSAQEAIDLVEEYGHPKVMGLDHDLGRGETAMKFVRWLSDSGYHMPDAYVHSANPVGAANLRSFMASWEKWLKGATPSAVPAPERDLAEQGATPEQLQQLRTMLRLDEVLDEEDAVVDSPSEAADEVADLEADDAMAAQEQMVDRG